MLVIIIPDVRKIMLILIHFTVQSSYLLVIAHLENLNDQRDIPSIPQKVIQPRVPRPVPEL